VAMTGAGGEATEGCPFWGVKKVDFATFDPVSLHNQDSYEHAHYVTREHNS